MTDWLARVSFTTKGKGLGTSLVEVSQNPLFPEPLAIPEGATHIRVLEVFKRQ